VIESAGPGTERPTAIVVQMPNASRPPEMVKATGKRLADTREALGRLRGKPFSQEEFADRLESNRGAYSMWERGHRLPDIVAMDQLTQEFDVPLEWIYQGKSARLPRDLYDALNEMGAINDHPPPARQHGA
jgi:transcriptional regulator with XRE-family HTH domain